jgi:Replication-relaxation
MQTDSLHRRLRFARPQPLEKGIVLSARDISIFETLHRHGPLPTNYLFEATKHIAEDYNGLQHRLTALYNGTKDGAFLIRPLQQFASFEARYQPLIYDLAPKAERALVERGLFARYATRRSDPFLHRFMGACVSASIEMGCKRHGLRYIGKEEIFASTKCPAATKESPNPLAIPISGFAGGRALIPDDLFGIQYGQQFYRFFAVEIDRNTESIEQRKLGQSTFGRKVHAYFDVFAKRTYRTHWGIPNLRVLSVTTSRIHRDNMLDFLAKQAGPTARFLFQEHKDFGTNWRVPRETLAGLLDKPWRSIVDNVQLHRTCKTSA